MKKIYCVRHAKSSWADLRLADVDRPLNKRGIRDAPRMAAYLSEQIAEVGLMLSSTSQRTVETADHFKQFIKVNTVELKERLYHAGLDTLISVIAEIDDSYNHAILFAHNPGMTYLYNHFTNTMIDNLPTCGIFKLEIDADHWSSINTTNTAATGLVYPKLLY